MIAYSNMLRMAAEKQERARLLAHFDLDEADLNSMRTDPGFVADLEHFIGQTMVRFDPQIRSALGPANALVAGLTGPFSPLTALLLNLIEVPAITAIETHWGSLTQKKDAPA